MADEDEESVAGEKKTWLNRSRVVLRVSELCDSESNSSTAGQVSTCDFDTRAAELGAL